MRDSLRSLERKADGRNGERWHSRLNTQLGVIAVIIICIVIVTAGFSGIYPFSLVYSNGEVDICIDMKTLVSSFGNCLFFIWVKKILIRVFLWKLS